MAPTDVAPTDVTIIGGGVIGSAVAYWLAAEPAFDGRVVVIERDPTYERASTPRSLGALRTQFSTPENIAIGQFCGSFVKAADEHLMVDGDAPALNFVEGGYLFLASEAGMEQLWANHTVQRQHGADVALLSPAEAAARFPWLNTDGLAGASLGLSGEGWLDPHALLQGIRRKARALGVDYRHDEVVGLERAGDRIAAVTCKRDGRLPCGFVVNAAGANGGAVAAMAGIPLPVGPRKRTRFYFLCQERIAPCPHTIDCSGISFRADGDGVLCGMPPLPEDDGETWDLEPDHGMFEARIWPLLAARVPAFEAVKVVRAWAGHYDYNAFDQNAILGPHPEVANFLFANGFSGHGLQQAPAVGRAIAECIAFGGYRSLDLSRLGYERIANDRPLRELAVI